MSLSTALSPSWLLFVPLLLFFSVLFLKKKNKEGNLPPSPPTLPIIGNLHQLGGLPHQSLRNLSNKYGPVVLMHFGSKPTLIISSAEAASEILKTNDLDFCTRPSLAGLKRLSYNHRDFSFSPYSEYWREMRKTCVLEILSLKRVRSFGFVRDEQVSQFVESIAESSPGPINLSQKVFSLADQITRRVVFGECHQRGDFDVSKFNELVYETTSLLGAFAASDFFPYFGWIIDKVTGLNTRLEKCFHAFDIIYQQAIDEHLDPERTKPEQEDIIDVLLGYLSQKDQNAGVTLTFSNIKAILMNIFLGGVDTSAVTMVWALTELIRKPETMAKVQEEIRNCAGKKGKVEEGDIDQLQYFKMVVKETLRLHPPAPLLIPRECRKDSKINGYDVYRKTRVLVNVWAIGRSKEYWENPDEFIPERFIDKSIDFKGQHFEYLPFGAGRRACPGMNMGMAVLELGLANLLYCFNWELPSGTNNEDISMEEAGGITIHKKLPLYLVAVKFDESPK